MSSELTILDPKAPAYAPVETERGDLMWDPSARNDGWRLAMMLAAGGELVPQHFRGKPADIFVVLATAKRLKLDPMTALRATFVVHGQPGFKTEFLVALAGAAGRSVRWEPTKQGPPMSVTAYFAEEPTARITVDMALAQAEGWTKNSKYKTMPEHMLRWRSAAWLVRTHMPHLLFGLQTVEEIEDVVVVEQQPPAKPEAPKRGVDAIDVALGKAEVVAADPEREKLLDNVKHIRADWTADRPRWDRLAAWAKEHNVKAWSELTNGQLRDAIAYAETVPTPPDTDERTLLKNTFRDLERELGYQPAIDLDSLTDEGLKAGISKMSAELDLKTQGQP